MTPEEFDEVEAMMRDLWESALAARNAAQEVLDKKQEWSLKLTKMQIEQAKKRLNK